ncbi:MAG TPA: M28 family peptidase [Candidatus Thermoplasmatota archaeon]|nr:M28 family peptidase [Candidatus Thermoplasmatota archaeon]
MRQVFLAAFALVAPALAGCLAPSSVEAPDAPALSPPPVVVPTVDAEALLAEVKAFAEEFPARRGDNAAHNGARAHLVESFRAMGYDAYEDEFEAPVSRVSTPTNAVGSGRLVNLCAFHWGATAPQEWIVVGAHFDVTDGAVYGAYDDGSGTMFVQHLARAFYGVPTARSIVFCNFDGEEQGLQGSKHLVEALAKGEWTLNNGTVLGMIDFDMAGIMFPAAPPLVADVVSPEMKAVLEAKAADLGIPEDAIEYRGIRGGSSDNGPFKAAEIPSVLLISDFDEIRYGPLAPPGFYPFWHQYDSYEGMVALAEGEANLKAGFQNVADLGADLLANMAGTMEMTFDLSVAGQ